MKVENVRRVGLTSCRLSKEETELAIGNGMLAKVVVGGLEEVTMVAVSLGDSCSREVCYELSSHDIGDWTEKKRGVCASTAALKHPEESKSSRATGTNERDHRQHLA